jgi:flagellar biosynthesis/type III secretory pathway protein FliH
MGKKDSFDKGYTQGFDGGYDEGYEEGQNDVLKQIYGIDKNAKHDTVTLKGKQF